MQNNMEFNSLSALVSTMNRYYDITNLDSVSVTLIFISVITVLCMVYKLCVLLRKKWPVDEDLISTFDQNVSAGCCRERIKGYREKVPGDSLGYANIIDEIHFAASRLCQKFYEENCIALLNKYPEAVNCPKPPSMYTPFLRACWCGNPRPIEYMLRNGADVTMRTKKGDTPMFLAIYRVTKKPHAFDPECIDILYNAGCNINIPKSHGYTPLHLAAKAGNVDLVRWLLVHGADPDSVTKCNKKAVDFAYKRGHKKVVSLLTVCTADEACQKRSTSGSYKKLQHIMLDKC
ncbi:poly [ADP-ribose] polymerase tankyrase-1 isoform X1 [Cryptotermes secundus]|uniref:poly [ADP-ribose] polymerase tankyrase-1 isoform X1 n=1 Tax=Cryptotermes secundus TaxID=105785 RepID=UPI000CD7C9A6|nr:poly [ADP-ribose] polymerase tankyrase-1 isoform X1 [Cryptotermes secundus]